MHPTQILLIINSTYYYGIVLTINDPIVMRDSYLKYTQSSFSVYGGLDSELQ